MLQEEILQLTVFTQIGMVTYLILMREKRLRGWAYQFYW